MCKNLLTWKNSSQASFRRHFGLMVSAFQDTGEAKMSQSAVFPFFDRLLRQEVFPGKPKGVADQLPIDLLALPEKAPCVTLIILYLFGLGLCEEEKKWTNSTVPLTTSLLEAQTNRYFLLHHESWYHLPRQFDALDYRWHLFTRGSTFLSNYVVTGEFYDRALQNSSHSRRNLSETVIHQWPGGNFLLCALCHAFFGTEVGRKWLPSGRERCEYAPYLLVPPLAMQDMS